MSLTDSEILLLEQLIHDREVDRLVNKLTNINEEKLLSRKIKKEKEPSMK